MKRRARMSRRADSIAATTLGSWSSLAAIAFWATICSSISWSSTCLEAASPASGRMPRCFWSAMVSCAAVRSSPLTLATTSVAPSAETSFFWPQATSRVAATAARAIAPIRARLIIISERIIDGSPSWPFPARGVARRATNRRGAHVRHASPGRTAAKRAIVETNLRQSRDGGAGCAKHASQRPERAKVPRSRSTQPPKRARKS